ncbi:cyclase family protein [Rhodococcoides corynebacterioides]|uniref:Cyclase family protein n=1 Tax=Rhodococcoides corynebacterioides TaxID=53972 RepID=A0ABS7P2J4_9NOCA|nr:cyclase family protein [Rhodococcus corynebacterioides]MBY6366602.1 cyclase family protein [Rhodococcus corynebacterioides]MBY6408665.1 cyclase family protein [Rhodococcus corynebacterioides]
MADRLLEAVTAGVRHVDLGRQLRVGMPQSPNHPQFWHTLPRRHGDMVRADGGSAANDMITTGTHVGTHIDALAHVSQDGRLHGDADATDSCIGGKYVEHGVHTIAPMVCRGVLLDVPATLGVERLDGGYEITVADLDATVARQGVAIEPGDVVLIRSGWSQLFEQGQPYVGGPSGVPGVSEAGATWLAERRIHAAGADTIAFERLAPGKGHGLLPAHRVLLVESGIYIIEALDLEQLAAEAIHEFTFVLVPLNIFGATGSPVRPLAVVSA